MKINWKLIFDVILGSILIVCLICFVVISYQYGYKKGAYDTAISYEDVLSQISSSIELNKIDESSKLTAEKEKVVPVQPTIKPSTWGGPELWVEVNKARVENGVNPLRQADELCTIASIRLNELLELDKLDGHEGFSNMPERRPDLKWIFEKYSISEFLAMGAGSAKETVDLWYGTLGHKKLITGGEYSVGCVYAQNSFAVAIAGY